MRSRNGIAVTALAAAMVLSAGPARGHSYGRLNVFGAVEVNQSVQTAQFLDGPAIGLSAHKPTTLRVYLSANRYDHGTFGVHFPTFSSVRADGTLTVRRAGAVIATLLAVNGPVAITPWFWPSTANANSSLNFNLASPPDGDLTFELSLVSLSPGIEAVNPAAFVRTFEHNRVLRVQAVKLEYDHDNNPATPTTKSPADSMVRDGKNWFVKSGPLAPCKLLYWVNPTPLPWTTDITATTSTSGTLNGTLAGMRFQGSTTYDNVYGWWQGSVSGNGAAQGPICTSPRGTAAHGNTDPVRYQRTFTHELYHNYYQDHLADGFANQTCDALPGADAGTGQIGLVGWDTGAGAPVPATKLDVMVPAQVTTAAWQAPARYTLFWNLWSPARESALDACHFDWWSLERDRFLPFGPVGTPRQPAPRLFVSGSIRPDGTGELLPAWELVRGIAVDAAARQGSFSVALIGLDGRVVARRRFEAHFFGDSLQPVPHSFSFVLPVPRDARGRRNLSEIRLRRGQKVLDSIPVTKEPPRLQILDPSPGQTPVLDKPFALRWAAADADGGSRHGLHFAVQYSPDKGEHFVGIANNVRGQQLLLDPQLLPGGSDVQLRVLATDGLNTAEAVVGPFLVPRKAPTVEIVSPPKDPMLLVAAGRSVTLLGTGESPDDGVMPGQRLRWDSDLQGELGAGLNIEVRLTEGLHTITLTGEDKAGVPATAEVQVQVVSTDQDSDQDGTADYADRCLSEFGPPANQGCPYTPENQPLAMKARVRDKKGRERFSFRNPKQVFFDVTIHNPRPEPVSLALLRLQGTDPRNLLTEREVAVQETLEPGGESTHTLRFRDVFETKGARSGGYSVVFESQDARREGVAHAATALLIERRK